MKTDNTRVIVALIVTLITWASAFAFVRDGLRYFGPGQLALLRFAIASIVLGVVALWRPVQRLRREDFGRVAVSGFLAITVYHTCLNFGEVKITAGAASFLVNTAPVFTALLATRFLGERLSAIAWCGIAISWMGALIIASGEHAGGSFWLQMFNPPALLIVVSAIAASASMILNKPLLQRYSALELVSYSVWIGTALLLIFVGQVLAQWNLAPMRGRFAAIYLGVFPAALAYVLWAFVLSRWTASRTVSFLNLVPPLATFLAWLWLHEVPSSRSLVGGIITLLGVVVVNARRPVKAMK